MSDRRRPGRPLKAGPAQSSQAALGVVRVEADFAREFPDGEPSAAEAMATLIRTGESLAREVERSMWAAFGVSHAVLNSLAVIDGAGEPLTPTQISERTFIASASMTATLDTLEFNDWVRRVPNPDDRRSLLIEITPEGKAIADQLLPGIRKLERAVFAGITAKERATLMALLAKVLDRVAIVAQGDPVHLDGRRVRPDRLP